MRTTACRRYAVTFRTLASGKVVADPQRRTAANGNDCSTALLRVDDEGEPTIISLIAFGDLADAVLGCGRGDSLSVSGRAKLTAWVDRTGVEKHGLGVSIEQFAALKPRLKPAARARRTAGQPARARRQTGRSVRDSGPPLPADDVSDLWAGGPLP